jgi:hypothetical protein
MLQCCSVEFEWEWGGGTSWWWIIRLQRRHVNIYHIYPWGLSLSFAVIYDCQSHIAFTAFFFCHISSLPREGCRFITKYSNQLSRLLKVKMEQNCTTERMRKNRKAIYVQSFWGACLCAISYFTVWIKNTSIRNKLNYDRHNWDKVTWTPVYETS